MLNLTTFKSDLKEALKDAAEQNASQETTMDEAMERLANAIAEKVDAYIKTATLTFVTGSIAVQGSPSAQANVAPIIINNGIS